MLEILFQYGNITVRTFNILLTLGFIVTSLFLIRYSLRQKMNVGFLLYSLPYLFLGGVLGGRLLFILENLSMFQGQWFQVLFVWDLRFSFFGIVYGLAITLFTLSKKRKEIIWSWLDAGTLALLIMMTFIHVGYFFSGANYGIPTNLPWGIAFDAQNIRFLSPVHPTQLYGALATLILLFYSIKKDKRIHLPGVTGARGLMVYGFLMTLLDFLHGVPSLYNKISFLALSSISFILLIHCSHKSHID